MPGRKGRHGRRFDVVNSFIVVARHADARAPSDRLSGDEHFEGQYDIREGVWAVAGTWDTSVDLAKALSMEPNDPDGMSGVVVKCDEWYGLFDPGLWTKLTAWRAK